jgi:hypothetical protein
MIWAAERISGTTGIATPVRDGNSSNLGANKDAVRWPPSNTGPLYRSNKNDCALVVLTQINTKFCGLDLLN